MRHFGIYQVVGNREYRGHKPETVFAARLDLPAAQRAMRRGDITYLGPVVPALEPGSFTFPEGWLSTAHINQTIKEPKGSFLVGRKE